MANKEKTAAGLRYAKIGRVKNVWADMISDRFPFRQKLSVPIPHPHLDNVLNHNPARLKDRSVPRNLQGCLPTCLGTLAVTFCAGVVGTFRRCQNQIDRSDIPANTVRIELFAGAVIDP